MPGAVVRGVHSGGEVGKGPWHSRSQGAACPWGCFCPLCLSPGEPTLGWEGGWLQLWRLMHSRSGDKDCVDRQAWGLSLAPLISLGQQCPPPRMGVRWHEIAGLKQLFQSPACSPAPCTVAMMVNLATPAGWGPLLDQARY